MLVSTSSSPSPRRSFLGRIAGGAVALAAGSLVPGRAEALSAAQTTDDPWLKTLTGKHKQVFDAPATNEGFPLIFAWAYLGTMAGTYGLKPNEVNAVIIARHFGIPMALSDSIWSKYKLGAMLGINDPQTKKPSTRNFFYKSKPGDLGMPDAAADKLLARGVVIGVCNLALTLVSAKAAPGAGVTPEAALKEWTAGLIPGAQVVPSGVMAVGRAQEKGCTYCFAG